MTRYAGPARISLSQPSDSALIDVGRKLAGELVARGEPVGVARHTLPDGGVVEASKVGGQHAIRIVTPPAPPGGPPRPMEEMIHLYFSSPGGLRIVDLGSKALVQTFATLNPYEVDDVSRDGGVVWMSGNGIGVRVDVRAPAAFGYNYPVDTLELDGDHAPGFAHVGAGVASPDGSRVLWAFVLTRDGDGVSVDGLTGFVLADGETLAPVRPAIRMGFRPQAAAWSGDGQRFFIAASLPTDSGGVATLAVSTSTADYVAMFDRDGVLLDTLQLSTWSFTPDTAYGRLIRAITAWGDRVFVLAETGWNTDLRLFVLTVEAGALVVADSIPIPAPATADVIHALRGGRLALLRGDDSMDLYNVAVSPPVLLGTVSGAEFSMVAATSPIAGTYWSNGVVRSGPDSRVGQPPDNRRFFFNGTTDTLAAYRDFAATAVYTLDLSTYAPRNRYRLAAVGARPKPRTSA